MAGFIDIACNFTHESFKVNLEEVINNAEEAGVEKFVLLCASLTDLCLLYTSPSPRDQRGSRMPSSA